MNFLAHLFLSGDNEHLMIGNFIADHIKGNKTAKYNVEIKKGIELHRNIDSFTDHHPVFIKTRDRLHANQHKYAGVIADMYYDHFLAVHWPKYSNIELTNYVTFCYGVLLRNYTLLPSRSKRILPFMMMQNWLVNYKTFDGMNRSFEMMSRRVKYNSNIQFAIDDLKKDYNLYNREFLDFFPDIMSFVNQKIDKLTGDI